MLLELWLLVRLELDELFSLDVLVELCELELPELGLLLGLDWLDWLRLDSLLWEEVD